MDKKTILIVDDTPDNLLFLTEILKDDYSVKAAPKGIIALKIAATKPDLILLDVLMPEMDGYEVCTKLKENEATKGIPVIFISGNSKAEEVEKGLALGAVDYLFKPIDGQAVLDAVEKHIVNK